MCVVDASFKNPLEVEEQATMPLAGGIANMGYQCGMIWGAALSAGAQAYRLYGPGPKAEVAGIVAAKRLLTAFRHHTKNEINCLEISHLDMQGDFDAGKILKFFVKGGPIGCFRMAARYAPDVRSEIDSVFSKDGFEAPESPVSCAAMLAKKMGVSEQHATMAAGFAGGIGLSGGACGALGAAIWINALNQPSEIEAFSYSGTWVEDTIEMFLESSDYEFECSAIVGRMFDDVGEHAEYIRAGGCANIMDALAEI
jgi:hypothetical protein